MREYNIIYGRKNIFKLNNKIMRKCSKKRINKNFVL